MVEKCHTELDKIAKITHLLLAIPAGTKGSYVGLSLLSVLHAPASSESSLHPAVLVPYVAVSVPKDFLREWIVTPVPDHNLGPVDHFLSYLYPSTCPTLVTLPG